MRFYYLTAFLAVISFPSVTQATNGGWNDPSKAQYHIQTDEGPERYFRYQTISGQYRKEKRLEDGTVIGTYGWVDDDGIFRMRDYIADNAGYRILKTKNVFVGRNRPVSQALSIAKQAPAEGGALLGAGRSPVVQTTTRPFISSPKVNYLPSGYSVANLQAPVFKFTEYSVPQTTPAFAYSTPNTLGAHTPDVELSLNSIPSSTEAPLLSSTLAPPEIPSTTPRTPIISTTPQTVYIPTTTPASISITARNYHSPSVQYVSTTPKYVPSAIPPPLSSNTLDSYYSSDPQYEHYPENQKFVNPYIYQNGPTYPIDKNGHTYNGNSNNLGNGYNRQFPLYDGISVTNDGFRYYIPKQYHEEQNLSNNEKSGSFGYVDPFGIRRVIYYNAGPDGFKHRKNNRYVGLDATPYDPRPY